MLASLSDLLKTLLETRQQELHDAYQKGEVVGVLVLGVFVLLAFAVFLTTRKEK